MALDLTDFSSNSNTLTNDGASEITTGLPFAAATNAADLEYTSTNDFLYAGDSASLSITGDMTVEGWFRFESSPLTAPAANYILSKRGGSGQRGWHLGIQDDSGDKLFIRFSSDGTAETLKTVSWSPTLATWYHIALTYDASEGEAKFYIDGSQQGATQTGLPTSIFDNTAAFNIGSQGNATSNTFDGSVKDVRVWNVVRTQSEISDNKDGFISNPSSVSGLVAYYPFEVPTSGGSVNINWF